MQRLNGSELFCLTLLFEFFNTCRKVQTKVYPSEPFRSVCTQDSLDRKVLSYAFYLTLQIIFDKKTNKYKNLKFNSAIKMMVHLRHHAINPFDLFKFTEIHTYYIYVTYKTKCRSSFILFFFCAY